MIQESQIKVQMGHLLLNNKIIEEKTDSSCCLMARERDYKGFGNLQLGNGVIEEWSNK